jgi:hypothetical protein
LLPESQILSVLSGGGKGTLFYELHQNILHSNLSVATVICRLEKSVEPKLPNLTVKITCIYRQAATKQTIFGDSQHSLAHL